MALEQFVPASQASSSSDASREECKSCSRVALPINFQRDDQSLEKSLAAEIQRKKYAEILQESSV